MTLFDQATLSQDQDFYLRIAACAENDVDLGDQLATTWAAYHQWAVAAAPGFADAYAYAVANGVENPGRDPAVITDEQIVAAVVAEAQAPAAT